MAGPGAARPREQVRAAVALGGLLLVSLVPWGLAWFGPDGSPPQVVGTAGYQAPRSVDAAGDAPADDGHDPPDEDGAASDGEGTSDDGATSDGHGPATVEFDDVCVVEVDPGQRDDDLRPWQFEACEHAPVELAESQTRWIVVVESLAGDAFTEADARGRVRRAGRGGLLLWSSHYPSLNPDLWVVAEGPFDDETAAARAADRIGGGAYPRELSDDEGDRYCIAADGCAGATGR